MTDWLLDTLLWTAALIALVLVLRRPVARWFGPQAAYALWAIPAVRLILPPLELPSWLNPAPAKSSEFTPEAGSLADPLFSIVQPQTHAATMGRLDAVPDQLIPATPLPILEIGISVWLVGAALFLLLRFRTYFRLRNDLLSQAREVGRYGKVRMMETPEASAPIAFGVIDPVIALPMDFMTQPDRTARDLALAHEFSHHKARDLLANMIVQPLFALHWFNPLGRYGWLAMRRDQEAACDARVISAKPAEERAAYANLITTFAAGPKFALAAPMACPVLGEKSIVHRLRSLKMSDISVRRRIAGRFMVGAALLALPLTASISYAESAAPAAPVSPVVPLAVAAPLPPLPPVPPAASEAPGLIQALETIDPGQTEADFEALEADLETLETELDGEIASELEEVERQADLQRNRSVEIRRSVHSHGMLSDEDIDEIMVAVREGLAEADQALVEAREGIALSRVEIEKSRTKVKMKCSSGQTEVSQTIEDGDGGQTIYLCQARIMVHALEGLKEAREAVAENPEIKGRMRQELLETLDQQIRKWERTQRS